MIKLDHMSHTYEDENGQTVYALKDISLEIQPGEFVAIIGTNGSGKSTLAKHFNVLLVPTEGTCEVLGMRTDDPANLWKIRQNVGMVFQNPDNQIVAAVVEEDVAFGPENLGVPPEEIRQRVSDALARVRMTAFAKHGPHLLSGGQKQRVAIAGILAMQSRCIVLDEPTAMLDPVGRKEVIQAAWKLNKEEHVTIILITHYMEEVIHADRVIVMDDGKLVMDGTPREIFSKVEELKSYRLDVPQVTELAYELRKAGMDLPEGILSQEEFMEYILPIFARKFPGQVKL